MNYLAWIWGVVLVALIVVNWKLNRRHRHESQTQGGDAKAAAQQPETIQLIPKAGHVWSDPAQFVALTEPLQALGFAEAGTYTIRELNGITVALCTQTADRVACAIYDQPKVGIWLDFYSHYQDGRRTTASTRPASGLDLQPGAMTFNAPGTAASALYQRFLRERPAGELQEMTPAIIGARLEAVYASEMAWRKQPNGTAAKPAQ